MRDIIAHLLLISCHVWRLVKTELLVSEQKAASLSSPRLRPGQQSQPVTPTVPSCRGGGRGAGDRLAASASKLTAICVWSLRQTSPVPTESAIFCKSEWKSGFRLRRQLVRLLSLLPTPHSTGALGYWRKSHRVEKRLSQNKGSQGQRPQPLSHIVLPGKGVCSHFTYYMDGWSGD